MWDFVMDKKWGWDRFSPRTSVSPANLHSICFSTIIFTITRGWHNRPGRSGRSANSLTNQIIKKLIIIIIIIIIIIEAWSWKYETSECPSTVRVHKEFIQINLISTKVIREHTQNAWHYWITFTFEK
jgi:hypothetical protein